MADAMTFPKTLDEFMEQYKIVDTEQVYTNGTELVPIFRIKQWEDAHKPKKGKWIKKMRIIETDKYASYTPEWYCSCCGGGYKPYIAELISFCPDCGAEMEKTDGKDN